MMYKTYVRDWKTPSTFKKHAGIKHILILKRKIIEG